MQLSSKFKSLKCI